jgi:hypothetical protein
MTKEQAMQRAQKTSIENPTVEIAVIHETVARDDWDIPETQYGFQPTESLWVLTPGTFTVEGAFLAGKKSDHSKDADCTVDPATGGCFVCGVDHSDECPECGRHGFHLDGCVRMGLSPMTPTPSANLPEGAN